LVLAGCAGNRHQSSGPAYDPYKPVEPVPPPVVTKKYQDRSAIPERQIIKQPIDTTVRQSNPYPNQQPKKASSPAVLALLGQAESSSRAGKLGSAAAKIERALRIEPRNANLIYKLAEVRMQQGKPRLAEDLGKKANILSSGDAGLKRKIWKLIADARQRQGNLPGADAAKAKAALY
jgi:predicted Zn-dependent protease